jgi:hypothetical protein
MDRSRAPSYDLFKLIVALVLAAILILMLLRGCATNPTPPAALVTPANEVMTPANNVIEPTAVAALPDATQPAPPSQAPPTATPLEVMPSATPTTEPTSEPTAATQTAAPAEAQAGVACNTSLPSRLRVGAAARVIQRLNMRSEPAINAPILQTNATGTQVEIIGGPICTPQGERAYQWWQIRLTDGAEGWSAETPLQQGSYFLEPIQ